MRRILFLIASCVAAFGLFAAACAPASSPAQKPPPVESSAKTAVPTAPTAPAATPQNPTPAGTAAKYGGTLNITVWDSLERHYDIHQTASITGILPFQHAYNNLVQYHAQEPTKIIGDLAQSWEVSTDGAVYTFHLPKGVKWHDGKPFTSADAKFSLDRMYNPPKGTIVPKVGELMKAIKNVEAPDAETVKVTLAYVSASFIPGLAGAMTVIFPQHVIEEKGDMKRAMVGTGPFKFKSDVPDNTFEMVKNNEYFKKGLPYLDGVKYYIIKDSATRFAAFRTKQIQMTFTTYGFSPAQLEQTKREMPDVTTAQFEGASFVGFYFPTTKAPWSDLRVRRAMSLAMDRQEAVRTLEQGLGAVSGPIPPGPWGLPQDEVVKLPGFRQPKDQDRAEAKRLLAEAGQSNLKFTLLHRAGRTYESSAEFFKDQMAKIGVDVSIKPIEYITLYDLMERRNFEAAMMKVAWVLPDPDDIILQYYRSKAIRNYGDFSDPEVDSLIDEQAKTLDEAKRKETVLKLQRSIMDKVPFVQSHWVNSVMGWQPEVKNFTRPLGQYTYWRMEEVWLNR